MITNLLGDKQLEFTLQLHQGMQNTDWVYMVYLQLVKPVAIDLADQPKWYESYSCAIRYNSLSAKQVDNSNVWFYGYKGNSQLAYASGVHNALNKDQQVDNHPYVINYDPKKTFVKTDAAKQDYFESCTFTRDFKTIWSDIPIVAGTTYNYIAGYKVYKSTGFA